MGKLAATGGWVRTVVARVTTNQVEIKKGGREGKEREREDPIWVEAL